MMYVHIFALQLFPVVILCILGPQAPSSTAGGNIKAENLVVGRYATSVQYLDEATFHVLDLYLNAQANQTPSNGGQHEHADRLQHPSSIYHCSVPDNFIACSALNPSHHVIRSYHLQHRHS
ncbi:uncharacterized protein LY89DRAFT_680045 [Mollisia scopiformis]|uniref:Secreted protein n=1 Tax=Mollisia scopiformis TaxID=149040 RepID=A0A194XT92_MOLSC|nr:uncharacterized protein LY89DRAFT_680045 [Mollisia scopiformis]KUJ23269.1 hypothetical protein LY89DRAFT_680045 [Mollisia scopiformis]